VPGVEEGSCEIGVFIETSAEIRHTVIGKCYSGVNILKHNRGRTVLNYPMKTNNFKLRT